MRSAEKFVNIKKFVFLSLCAKKISLLFRIHKLFLKRFILQCATFRVIFELRDKSSEFTDKACGTQYFVTTLRKVSLCAEDPRFDHFVVDLRSGIMAG
jgi:hypothetical protein